MAINKISNPALISIDSGKKISNGSKPSISTELINRGPRPSGFVPEGRPAVREADAIVRNPQGPSTPGGHPGVVAQPGVVAPILEAQGLSPSGRPVVDNKPSLESLVYTRTGDSKKI